VLTSLLDHEKINKITIIKWIPLTFVDTFGTIFWSNVKPVSADGIFPTVYILSLSLIGLIQGKVANLVDTKLANVFGDVCFFFKSSEFSSEELTKLGILY